MSNEARTNIDGQIEDAVNREDIAELLRLKDLIHKQGEEVQRPGEMAPHVEIEPTPAVAEALSSREDLVTETAGIVSVANRIAQAIRRVEFKQDRRQRPHLPVIVAEGDSWFLHQLVEDTLDHLRLDRFNVCSLAAAGDTVANTLAGERYVDALREEGSRVFLFSGGGNDLLGEGRIADVVKRDEPGTAPHELVIDQPFGRHLGDVIALYERMISIVAREVPGAQVFAHGYDHVARVDAGPWIWPFLKEKGYSRESAVAVLRVLLDRFNTELEELDARHANFTYVDVRGVIGSHPTSWFDVIHPRSPGFAKVAKKLGDEVYAFLDRASAAQPDFGEAAFAIGIGAPTTRVAASGRELHANEAITRAFSRREMTDFERVRAAVDRLPPEDQWIRFRDPLVRKHIRDVITLLRDPGAGQTRRNVENRMRTRPKAVVCDAEIGVASAQRVPSSGSIRDSLVDVELDLVEALFGNTELEPIQILLKGYEAAKAVGRVQIMSQHGIHVAHGSGFFVAPGLLLTNHHVLPNADAARRSFIILHDETPLDGALPDPIRFRITEDVFWASEVLDYAFASVERINRDGTNLDEYGHLPLIQESGKALTFEPVSIVQHPGGDPKAIAIRNSFVMGRLGDGVYYTTDTLGGSSGSPVLNREWQVVALHHRYVPHPTQKGGVLANRGIRISNIYEDLFREQGLGNRMAARVLEQLNAERIARFDADIGVEQVSTAASPMQATRTVECGVYEGLTETEFLAAIASGEEGPEASDIPLPSALSEASLISSVETLRLDPDAVLRRIGDEGYRFIVGHEVSSQAHYDRRLRHPIVPGGASGVTIGIGYDLGHTSVSEFRGHWGDLLPSEDVARLQTCIGRTRASAAAALPDVRDISIAFEKAVRVFERASLPKVYAQIERHIRTDALDRLPASCVAALVSLTYNRGPSFQRAGERYREMRGIREAINAGGLNRVPDLIRAMKRLWEGKPNVRGLLRRRDEEAQMFEAGLGDLEHLGTIEALQLLPDTKTEEYDPAPDTDEESTIPVPETFVEAALPRLTPGDVAWVSTFSNNPDYAHLPTNAQGASFRLDASVIEAAIALGKYRPHFTTQDHLIVGIRGALIMTGEDEALQRDSIMLMEQKPDHRTFRCVMAVYHRSKGKVSAFRASTVPNRGGVAACANLLNGHGGRLANLLPTGCYELCVGTHFGKKTTIPTVLRLGRGPSPDTALKVTTLRTKNDGVFGTKDLWDPCRPADNIHPAFSSSTADFSSLGCLTVPGRFSNGRHKGTWAVFREAAGFDDDRHMGVRYDLLLTTGMELAAIAAAPVGSRDDLRRLAHGSVGEEVRALQSALDVTVDGQFGPLTKKRLTERERDVGDGASTGIYSVLSRKKLGFDAFLHMMAGADV